MATELRETAGKVLGDAKLTEAGETEKSKV
jgi:uncharacterized protein YjbJ (UPF0337 family)